MINPKYGFVKLYRDIIHWEWYSSPNTFRLFMHCLLCANHKPKKWNGITINAGSFVTSTGNLAKELRLTRQQIKTAIQHLKSTHYITCETTSQYTVITIKNYDFYQSNNPHNNYQITNEYPTSNQQITTTNKENKEKNENNNVDEILKKLEEKYNIT